MRSPAPAQYRALTLVSALVVGLTASALTATSASAATPDCSALTAPIYQRVNPTSSANLLTPWKSEADNAAVKYGFTEDHGAPFKAATKATSGTVGVHRLFNAKTGDFVWITDGPEVASAIAKYGYADNGVNFYAAATPAPGCTPVYRLLKGTKHRFTATTTERDALAQAGWRSEGTAFYAAPGTTVVPPPDPPTPPDTDTKFTLATMPDTQQETGVGDPRFRQRSQWLADHKTDLDLRFVGHTGDVVNWGWLVPSQYAVASDAMKPLEQAKIPYALSIGNHDTRAVGSDGVPGSRGYGGSAYVGNPECLERLGPVECNTQRLVRHTEEFNANFTAARYTDVSGAYQSGKVDNIYSTFSAGGVKWMVLTLELWPRTEVVAWAKNVVASHPDTNVVIQTHSYLNGDGSISGSNGGYGANSPQYVFDNLVKVYPNIKMVFSGHVGQAASRTDVGVNGNKIVSFLQCFHSTTNPVRLTEVDTAKGTLSSKIFVPKDNAYWNQYDTTTSGLSFVKPAN